MNRKSDGLHQGVQDHISFKSFESLMVNEVQKNCLIVGGSLFSHSLVIAFLPPAGNIRNKYLSPFSSPPGIFPKYITSKLKLISVLIMDLIAAITSIQ